MTSGGEAGPSPVELSFAPRSRDRPGGEGARGYMMRRLLLTAVIGFGVLGALLSITSPFSGSAREQAPPAAPQNQAAPFSTDDQPRPSSGHQPRPAEKYVPSRQRPHMGAEEASGGSSPPSNSPPMVVAAEDQANGAEGSGDRNGLSLTRPSKTTTGRTTDRASDPSPTKPVSPAPSSDAGSTDGRGLTAP